jgi:hypothetical protein
MNPVSSGANGAVHAWNDALNRKDIGALERLYAEQVSYYGQSLSGAEVVKRKRAALEKAPQFVQQIVGEIAVTEEQGKSVARFRKRSGVPPKLGEVDAQLRLAPAQGGAYVITEETDAVTEKRKSSSPQTCEDAVEAAVGPAERAAMERIQRLVDKAPNRKELHAGGIGPIGPEANGDYIYTIMLGVHHPERFETMVAYTIDGRTGNVTVSEGAEEKGLRISAADKERIVKACYP